ncbi:DUF3047 domain-containing protein [Aliifodinibius sp. S!AR15-10]|uniref:DUF3047 domain-containing protein n=1 Tax=Aliifodinibius sp. S!AR15-10 TaxID=2950437 RepID=UPI002864592D|nr:DUF3047 domain-containing protein [Aliifodinibius sp. S!AR15-10]MDR8391764.1 DUF3047 domain-containing protein [Aliifodinibius sp. S!AR15-10]
MKNLISVTLFLTFWLIIFSPICAQTHTDENGSEKQPNKVFLIDDFENDRVGRLPHKWYNRDGERRPFLYPEEERASYKYQVVEENGNKYLHYDGTRAKHINFPLLYREDLNIYETPILRWRWRVHEIPEGGNEGDEDRNDTAASIYVVFDMGRVALFKKVPKSIRYTWSSTLKEGTELSEFFGNQKIVVMKSGTEGLGRWHTFQRNIVEDYRRLFGDDPPEKPLAILLLSDGNSTGQRAVADYDDIALLPVMQ